MEGLNPIHLSWHSPKANWGCLSFHFAFLNRNCWVVFVSPVHALRHLSKWPLQTPKTSQNGPFPFFSGKWSESKTKCAAVLFSGHLAIPQTAGIYPCSLSSNECCVHGRAGWVRNKWLKWQRPELIRGLLKERTFAVMTNQALFCLKTVL